MNKTNKQITIIGSGVSGLTTAIVMQEAGYSVQIVTDKLPDKTTSIKAGAIWFPYAIEPKEQVNTWSAQSYEKYETLCTAKETGVSMIKTIILIDKEEDAWWLNAFPNKQFRKATISEMPKGYKLGYIANVPLISTSIYLDYLLNEFKRLGGKLTIQHINSIEKLEKENNIIINCTGLGSRELMKDQSMYPIQGQIVKTSKLPNINCILDGTERAVSSDFAYIFPHKDYTILGGTSVKNEESTTVNDMVTKGIIERCQSIEPNLQNFDIETVYVGLRPARPAIRLERNGNLIHNYGHGGAGFTVAWGCAWAVKSLIAKIK